MVWCPPLLLTRATLQRGRRGESPVASSRTAGTGSTRHLVPAADTPPWADGRRTISRHDVSRTPSCSRRVIVRSKPRPSTTTAETARHRTHSSADHARIAAALASIISVRSNRSALSSAASPGQTRWPIHACHPPDASSAKHPSTTPVPEAAPSPSTSCSRDASTPGNGRVPPVRRPSIGLE